VPVVRVQHVCQATTPGVALLVSQVILSLFQTLGYLALIAIAFGAVERSEWPPLVRSLVQGCIFGGGAVLAMFEPAELAEGVQIDGRALIVGFGAAFGGWPAALVATLMAVIMRVLLGGAGVGPGVAGIAIAAVLGLFWRYRLKPAGRLGVVNLLGLGLLISLHLLASAVLGYALLVTMLTHIAPYVVSASVVAALFLGLFIERELRQIAREQHWRRNALTDSLTGLPNRRAFEQGMGGLRVAGRPASLLIVDVDHFKLVNDTHGHAAGDYVLQRLAKTLRSNLRHDDLLARLGGEELSILLPGSGVPEATAVAERLRAAVEAMGLEWQGLPLEVTISIGVAVGDGTTPASTLFTQADAALYAAKRGGRNRVVCAGQVLFEPPVSARPGEELAERRRARHRVA
jgi:diguanylate cyclase